MVKFAIKVDWMNMIVEFSPNLNIISNKTDSDKTLFQIEYNSNYTEKKFPSFSFNNNELEMDEVFDNDDKFWVGLIDLPGAAAPQVQPSIPMTTPVSSNVLPSPAPNATQNVGNNLEKEKIQAQMESIQKMVANLDSQFQAGKLDQDTYIKKKNYLAGKLGSLMGQLESIN